MTEANPSPQPIFLFSLARSGSTLLQRLLASSDEIATVSEPWLLLPLMYTIRNEGHFTDYDQAAAVQALQDLLKELPRGREDYLDAIKQCSLDIYGKLSNGEARYFLDKTPRYSLIADEIVSTFASEAKYIFLWRNPISVLASMIESFDDGRFNPFRYRVHLYKGLANLIDTHMADPSRFHTLRYEDLVADPRAELQRIAAYLEIPANFSLPSLEEARLTGRLGDKWGVKTYHNVSTEPTDKWKKTLANPIRKAWCRRYLRWLGGERLNYMGYNVKELLMELDSIPTTLSGIGTDLVWSSYGAAYTMLEPWVFRAKLKQGLRDWKNVQPLR